ncbi:hypothetical protein GCM10009760_51540 [Kitasatospora kazusensis]|uniref:Type VII secretion system (Wss) protein ESAT-6 n=1 Tax=Kitasatospora kazusensis TaxID=407974 RepID=A0ABN3A4A4_9ACTN
MDEQQNTELRATERVEPEGFQERLAPVEGLEMGRLREGTVVDATPVMAREMPFESVPLQAREGTVVDATPAMAREMPFEGVPLLAREGTVVDATPAEMSPLLPREGVPAEMSPLLAREGTVVDATPAEMSPLLPREGVPAETSPLLPEEGIPAESRLQPREGTMVDRTPVETGDSARIAATPTQATQLTPAQISSAPASGSGSGSGGGAGQGFQVSPEQYSAAVSPMLAASEQIASLYAGLNSYLPSMESQAPWGKDESGKQFSEGDKGYLKYSADTLKALKGMPDGLKYIADGLKAMAQGYEGADGSTASGLTDQDNQLQASPPPTWSPGVHTPISPSITLEHMNQSGRH